MADECGCVFCRPSVKVLSLTPAIKEELAQAIEDGDLDALDEILARGEQ